jgi:cyclase
MIAVCYLAQKSECRETIQTMNRLLLLPLIFLSFNLSAQSDNMDSVDIKSTHIRGNIHMLEGRGGNIGLSVGEDGVLMVDDQFAPLTNKIAMAIKELSDKRIEFVINTHVHGDHTGGNENLRNLGAHIVAHDQVRQRLQRGLINRATGEAGPGAPEKALPDITFKDSLSFHFNGEEIRVIKVPSAHTDGDCIVHFTGSNVIHAGDIFRTTSYPVVDTNHGGTFRGTLGALSMLLQLADDDTIIIPGHGVPSSKKDVEKWRKMLTTISSRIHQSVETGDKLEEALARNPGMEFNDRWATADGWASTRTFMSTIYNELNQH